MQLWKFLTLNTEPLVFSQMPMQDVQLHCRHRIKIAFKNFHSLEVTSDVDQQPAPGKPWLVVNLNSRKKVSIAIGVEQLKEGLKSTQRANNSRSTQQRLAAGD